MEPVCRIHFWDPASKKGFGHVSLQIIGGCYISFWPGIELTNLITAIMGCQGKWYGSFEAEIEERGYPRTTHDLRDLDTDKITRWWNKFTDSNPNWTLLTQSCSNVVYMALCEGSDRFKGLIKGLITTPNAVSQMAIYV